MPKFVDLGVLEKGIDISPLLEKTGDAKRLRNMLVERGGKTVDEATSLVEELVAAELEGAGRNVIGLMRTRLLKVFEIRDELRTKYINLGDRLRAPTTAEQLAADRAVFADLFNRLDQTLAELSKRNLDADISRLKKINTQALLTKLSEAEKRNPEPTDIEYYTREGLKGLREDAYRKRVTVARQLVDVYEELTDAQLAELIQRDNDRIAIEALDERNMIGAEQRDPYFERVEEPYRLLPDQVLARYELRVAIEEMIPGAKVRLKELPETPAFLAQARAASHKGETFTMDVEFWIRHPKTGEFNADGITAQKGGVFTFLERKEALRIWDESGFSRDVLAEKITVMLRRHLDIARTLRETKFRGGWDYSTNVPELNKLIATKIVELHEPEATEFLHVLPPDELPPEIPDLGEP